MNIFTIEICCWFVEGEDSAVEAENFSQRQSNDDASEDDGGEYSSVRPSAGASGEPPRSDERSSVRPSRASDRETVAPAQTSGGAAATPDGSVSTTPPPANARTTGHDTERPPMFGN